MHGTSPALLLPILKFNVTPTTFKRFITSKTEYPFPVPTFNISGWCCFFIPYLSVSTCALAKSKRVYNLVYNIRQGCRNRSQTQSTPLSCCCLPMKGIKLFGTPIVIPLFFHWSEHQLIKISK